MSTVSEMDAQHSKDIHELKQQIATMQADIAHMRELMDAWNSVKGFANTMRFLALLTRWLLIVGGTVGAVWYFIKFGHLPVDGGK